MTRGVSESTLCGISMWSESFNVWDKCCSCKWCEVKQENPVSATSPRIICGTAFHLCIHSSSVWIDPISPFLFLTLIQICRHIVLKHYVHSSLFGYFPNFRLKVTFFSEAHIAQYVLLYIPQEAVTTDEQMETLVLLSLNTCRSERQTTAFARNWGDPLELMMWKEQKTLAILWNVFCEHPTLSVRSWECEWHFDCSFAGGRLGTSTDWIKYGGCT